MADKSFFEFKLEADTTTPSGTMPFINTIFLDIVNYDEVTPYYFNSWYKDQLDHIPEEKTQRARFWLTKALPYKKEKLWSNVEGELVLDTADYEITDAVFLDWVRYLMAVYDDKSKMKIFKQINVTAFQTCANNNYESWALGNFVDISKFEYTDAEWNAQTGDYYPFDKCCADKFMVAARGKWPKTYTWDAWYMKVELIWDDILYYFYDTELSMNVPAGAYLYINRWGLSWQIVPLSGEVVVDWNQWAQTSFAWTWTNLNEWEDFWLSSPHWWVMYEDYWDILSFACLDWIIHLNHSWTTPWETETTVCGSMTTNTINGVNPPKFLISSMINFAPNDIVALYDVSDWEMKYWLPWFLKFYFKSTNSFFISNDYTDIVEFVDYIILLWPNKTWVAYPYLNVEAPWVVYNLYRTIWDWYLNRDSWVSWDDNFILGTAKWVWALTLSAQSTTNNRFIVTPTRQFQWWPFLEDFSHFSRELWDVCWMSMEEKQFKLYIATETGTIVWIKSVEHNYWRQHILSDKTINTFKAWVFIWDWVYTRGWDEEVETYISFMFGDQTMMIPKNIHALKLAMGRDSVITKGNTILQTTITLWWRTTQLNYSDWQTSMWIQEMMNLKKTGNEDAEYKEYQNEIEIFSGEGHWKPVPHRQYNMHKITAFSEYITNSESSETSDFDDKYTLANRASVHMDLWYMADTVCFKLITKWKDNLEFYWGQIWYSLTNEVGWSLDNSIVVDGKAEDGSSPIVPK